MNYPLNIAPNSFVKVINGLPTGTPFTLPTNYLTDDGNIIPNVALLPPEEKLIAGLWPVGEAIPTFDARYQTIEPDYILNTDHVLLVYVVNNIPLDELKQTAIKKAYAKCAATLDAQTVGYSQVEVATFPLIQAEIVAFNAAGEVGAMMQAIISRGRHTGETLSALLTPKIVIQQEALNNRDDNVSAILVMSYAPVLADFIDGLG